MFLNSVVSRKTVTGLVALAIAVGAAVCLPEPVSAKSFQWISYNGRGTYGGTFTFLDKCCTSTTGDWNEWIFDDYLDGYDHTFLAQHRNSTGSWATASNGSKYVPDGYDMRFNLYLRKGDVRFQMCVWVPDDGLVRCEWYYTQNN